MKRYLFDISEASALLERFLAGKTFDDYKVDPLLRAAVERQFEIMGEALRHAIRLDPTLEQRVSSARQIVDFRNLLIHAYFSISNEIVWGVIETGWPVLRSEVARLLEAEP